MIKDEYFTLYNGVTIPKVALGTWQSSPSDAYNAVISAIKAGYTHIDTALVYGNEEAVGKAIKDSKIERDKIFVTTKCPAEVKTYEGALESFNTSLKNLGLDYIDLYLIHAPWPWSEMGKNCDEGNIEVWKAFVKLYNEKKIRAIGVSNFSPHDIKNVWDATGFKPMVNQIRYFVGYTQKEYTDYCDVNNILVEAYSPLATGSIVNDERFKSLEAKYNKTIPQILIRFCLENNRLPLPKSVHEERIISNIDLDFKISKEDMEYLNSL